MSDWAHYLMVEAARWLNTIVHLIGLVVAVWAFFRCRKGGYLVLALYFALILFAWHVWPSVSRAIFSHRAPIESQQKADTEGRQAVDQVSAQEEPRVPIHRINIQLAPVVLVFGLWLLARREAKYHRPDTAPGPTPIAP